MTHSYSHTSLAALFAAVLTACGGGGSDTPAEGNGPAPAPIPAPAPAPAPAADFTISLSADKALLIQGQTATVTATVTRRPGFDGAVSITLANLPAGVSASPVIITSGATSAPITLSALTRAPHSLPTAASAAGTSGAQSASSALTVTVGGLPGVVDTSFNGGVQLTSVAEGEDYAFAMAVQPDGKVVTVGRTSTVAGGTDIAITRHLRDGTLDASFGSGGSVVTAIAPGRGADEARAVLVEPDGRIVIGGYNAAGSADTGFGTGGQVITPVAANGRSDSGRALSLQLDERVSTVRVLQAGEASDAGSYKFALLRYWL